MQNKFFHSPKNIKIIGTKLSQPKKTFSKHTNIRTKATYSSRKLDESLTMKASAWANSGSELPGCDADGWHIRSELSGCDGNGWHIRSELSGCDANGWHIRSELSGCDANDWHIKSELSGCDANGSHIILTTLPPQIATVNLAKGFAWLWKNWE